MRKFLAFFVVGMLSFNALHADGTATALSYLLREIPLFTTFWLGQHEGPQIYSWESGGPMAIRSNDNGQALQGALILGHIDEAQTALNALRQSGSEDAIQEAFCYVMNTVSIAFKHQSINFILNNLKKEYITQEFLKGARWTLSFRLASEHDESQTIGRLQKLVDEAESQPKS